MNLISCDNCGVVLDKDKLNFPHDIRDSDDAVDHTKGMWYDKQWHSYVACPVCQEPVPGEPE